jgi:phage FluMu gp28-like protein
VIDKERDLTAFVLRFKDGQKIMALSSHPDVFRGQGRGHHPRRVRLPPPAPPGPQGANASAKVWGHQIRIISTHNGEGPPLQPRWSGTSAGQARLGPPPVTLLDAVEQGLVEKIQKLPAPTRPPARRSTTRSAPTASTRTSWQEEYLCQPSSEQSSLLSYDLIRACEVDNLQLLADVGQLPAGKTLYAGFDVGRKRDLSCLWVLERVGDVYWTRLLRTLQGVHYTAQEDLLRLLLKNRAVKRLCIDSTGIGAMLAERLNQPSAAGPSR